ncbi:amidase [Siminovitchia sediminis]|uniref:Amidase n=1 Tax=Siminovitchia sediminis TaxID=1274353 RepID=A0ABW4KGS6_9BACI
MTDIAFLTATELAPIIQTKQLSPVELTRHILDRMEIFDPKINSYITKLNELALKQAREAENSIMHGQYRGPLHGIPIGIKDNYETKGIRTTAGSKVFAQYTPNKTATTVKKLLGAGGIMLGKLNMHPLGTGLTGTNPLFGNTRNPWNIHYMPGASSSGSAAALAAGLATLTTGTDTFGSIRVPAAMSGIYGLKPTYGLVSTYGLIPLAWSLDHAGPMARSVSDLALMLHYMAGFDPKDPTSLKIPAQDYTANLKKGITGVNIGIPTYFLKGLDPDIEKLFHRAVSTLRALGAEIKEIEIPELSMSTFSGYVIMPGEASAHTYDMLQTQPQDFPTDTRALLLSGSLTSTPQYLKAQQARRKLVKAFKKIFKNIDIILGPTIPITTPAFNKNWVAQNLEVIKACLPFTAPANLTGTPSLSVPMGLCSKGLPMGMQLIGNHLSEKLLLQAGHAWEQTNPLSFKMNS